MAWARGLGDKENWGQGERLVLSSHLLSRMALRKAEIWSGQGVGGVGGVGGRGRSLTPTLPTLPTLKKQVISGLCD
ncbi:hypothetical protein A6V25_24340 [Nostoc sp. ATCC 53789]|nr:hypothetical protein A6V25_24340 [Nostoc sp. ATCC 53789]